MNLEDAETLHPILKPFPVVQSAALLIDSNLILLKTFQTKETTTVRLKPFVYLNIDDFKDFASFTLLT